MNPPTTPASDTPEWNPDESLLINYVFDRFNDGICTLILNEPQTRELWDAVDAQSKKLRHLERTNAGLLAALEKEFAENVKLGPRTVLFDHQLFAVQQESRIRAAILAARPTSGEKEKS
jgi:hypothetical protein